MFRYFLGVGSSVLLITAGFLVFAAIAAVTETSEQSSSSIGVILAIGGIFLASVTTFTGVYFGWRRDRREARLLELKLHELEARNAAADPDHE